MNVMQHSLAETLDRVNEAFFYEQPLDAMDSRRIAEWIAGRQGMPGAYAGMFAPTDLDFQQGLQLFTGEKISTRAGTAHILGQEASRALLLMEVGDIAVRDAVNRARDGILARMSEDEENYATYCCAKCSVALWRNLAAGGLDDQAGRLTAAMQVLKDHRDDKNRWGRFPFHYTLLALSEIDLPEAMEELRHAAPAVERSLKRKGTENQFEKRRRHLAERVLSKI